MCASDCSPCNKNEPVEQPEPGQEWTQGDKASKADIINQAMLQDKEEGIEEAITITNLKKNIGMLRQWLNESRITDVEKMVTNEQIELWLLT